MQHPRHTVLHLAITAMLATSPLAGAITTAHAEATEVHIFHNYGILYLPIMVMVNKHPLERRAEATDLGDMKASYRVLDGDNVISDAMLSGTLDAASLGVPGFLTLWNRARGSTMRMRGLSLLSSSPMHLITRSPSVEMLVGLSDKDRIVMPDIKTLPPAAVLQMAAAKTFGDERFDKLGPITMPLPHPDATAVTLTDGSQTDSCMVSPSFSHTEAAVPGLYHVFNMIDMLGNITLDVAYTSKKFYEANPKLLAAFVTTFDEANALIAKDKAKAAQIYIVQSRVKNSSKKVKKVPDDPDLRFTITPVGVAHYTKFMQRVGTFKNRPASQKDLFFLTMRSRQGS